MKVWSIGTIVCILATGSLTPHHLERFGPQISGAFFALSVSDLKASAAWYSEKLGLRVTREIPEAHVTILESQGLKRRTSDSTVRPLSPLPASVAPSRVDQYLPMPIFCGHGSQSVLHT